MGKKSHKETTTTTLPAWAQGLATGAGNSILNTVNGNQHNLTDLQGQVQAQLPGLAQNAFDTSKLSGGFNYLNDVLGGKYLNQNNPALQGMIDQTNQQVGNDINAQFSRAGRTGGGYNVEALGQGLANADNNLRYTNYANERQQQTQAAGLLPSLNASQYAGITPYLAATQLAGQLPYYGIQNLGQVGNLYSGQGTSSSTKPGGWLDSLLGAGASLGSAAIMASDRRLKRNIEKVGEASDGLGIYTWVYRNDPDNATYRGVMADEVERLRPWAFVPNFKGDYAGVNYATLGSVA